MKIDFLKKLRLRPLLYNKKFTVTISLILSFAIWLVVMINRNPIRDQIFTDVTATVSIDNTVASEMGLGIVSDIYSQKFTVTVSGPNYIVSSLTASDFMLSASVTDVTAAGTYTLDVLGTRNSTKSGYTFSSISPSTIDVTFDYIDTREFTLVPKLIGVSASDGLVAETPVVSSSENSTITVKGPRSVIDHIDSVGSLAEVNTTLNTTTTFDSDIVLYDAKAEIIYRYANDGKVYDKNDNIVENTYLTLSFTSVKVSQPISKRATVSVKATFSNLPSGLKESNINWTVDHSSVSVIGPPDVINKLTEITLSAIDFRTVSTTSSSFEVSPTLPDGVKILDNIEFFTVAVETSNYAEKTVTVTDIRYTGLSANLSAKTHGKISNVKICGPADVIEKITRSDIYATLDLTDRSAGDHTVDAVIKSDKYTTVWQVGTYSTPVTIN